MQTRYIAHTTEVLSIANHTVDLLMSCVVVTAVVAGYILGFRRSQHQEDWAYVDQETDAFIGGCTEAVTIDPDIDAEVEQLFSESSHETRRESIGDIAFTYIQKRSILCNYRKLHPEFGKGVKFSGKQNIEQLWEQYLDTLVVVVL